MTCTSSRRPPPLHKLQGDVLGALAADAVAVLAEEVRRQDLEVRRVLDIGCGPGVATVDLARQFPAAASWPSTARPRCWARATARVDPLRAWPIGWRPPWPSSPAGSGRSNGPRSCGRRWWSTTSATRRRRCVRSRRVLAPGGVLALVERARPLRVPPAGADTGLWDRLDAAGEHWFAGIRAALPGRRPFGRLPLDAGRRRPRRGGRRGAHASTSTARSTAPGRRFAHEHLTHTRTRLEGHAEPADLAALDELLAGGVEQCDDLSLHASSISIWPEWPR